MIFYRNSLKSSMTESSQSNDDNEDVAAKRARVDLNDSFYDSDEDEIMLREALQSSSDRTAPETGSVLNVSC